MIMYFKDSIELLESKQYENRLMTNLHKKSRFMVDSRDFIQVVYIYRRV